MSANDTNSANGERKAWFKKAELLYPELSYQITGACFATHNMVGPYAREKQYADVLEEKLRERRLPYEREVRIGTSGNIIDFVVNREVAVELKAKRMLLKDDYYQSQRYLQESGLRLCLLVNFRNKNIRPVRIVRIDRLHRGRLQGEYTY
jgi:GxxExxY protein